MKNLITKLSFSILLLIFLIACSNESEDKKTEDTKNDQETAATKANPEKFEDVLNIAYSAQPPTLDPHITTAVATSDIMRGVYETLITADADYNFKPMLAESYEVSEDGTEITFKLRQGVLFHDGEEMKAEDVVASMERWKEQSSRATPFREAKFEEIDEYTVVFKLKEPVSTTLSVLTGMLGSFPAIMPKKIVDGADERGIKEFIGTGPFKYEEWKQDGYVKLSKNPNYQSRDDEPSGLSGKKEALIEEVYFHIVTDASTRVAGVLSGEYDIIHATPYDQAEMIENNPDTENHIVPGSTYVFVLNKQQEVFKDVEVRKAVRLALNVDEIMHGAFADDQYYEINHNLVKPYLTNRFNTEVGKAELLEYDPEAAKEKLEELGVAGEEIIIITTRDYEDQYNTSLVAQQQLEAVGFDVKLEVYDWPTLLDKTEDASAYHINIMGWGPQPEPTSYGFLREGYDSGWIEDDSFFKLIDDFRNQPSLEDTAAAYEAIVQWMTDNVPLIKLGDSYRIASTTNKVNNFQFQDGFIIWNLSVSK